MSFPVLTAHQIYPYFFQLGGRLSPISIRDQMVRGQLLIEQAFHAGLIGGRDRRPLLVVGAGAAGATVAMAAASLHVPTLLVDEGAAPFRLQAGCRTRLLDPAHYDWSLDHWGVQTYPWPPGQVWPRTPLPWRRDFSNRLAAAWTIQLSQAVRRFPWLRAMFMTRARPQNAHPWGWTFQLMTASGNTMSVMVVWTVGFGNETSNVRPSHICNHALDPAGQPFPFFGFPFWSTDPYMHPTYRLPPETTPTIVISGAGDGGLQDFLRIVAHPSFQAAGDVFGAIGSLPAWLPCHLLSFDARAQRAFHWGDRAMTGWNGYDHTVLQTIHDEHRRLARTLARDPAVRKDIDNILRPDLAKDLHLIHDCTHFPNVYPLNRFLVLLIAECLGRPGLLMPRRRVLEVNSTDLSRHLCSGSHIACHGEEHDVHLVNAPHCLLPFDPHATVVETVNANTVIIRHGIDVHTLTQPHLPDIALPRQLPPFHVH